MIFTYYLYSCAVFMSILLLVIVFHKPSYNRLFKQSVKVKPIIAIIGVLLFSLCYPFFIISILLTEFKKKIPKKDTNINKVTHTNSIITIHSKMIKNPKMPQEVIENTMAFEIGKLILKNKSLYKVTDKNKYVEYAVKVITT